MNINKKMKKFAKILAASLVITSFCPTVSGLPVQVNSSVEVQAAVKAKAPSCVAKQTVYVVASFGGPNEEMSLRIFLDFQTAIFSSRI